MESSNKNKELVYSKITQREVLYSAIFSLVLSLLGIVLTAHNFAKDQFYTLGRSGSLESRADYPIYFWVANLIYFAFGVLFLFFCKIFVFASKENEDNSDRTN